MTDTIQIPSVANKDEIARLVVMAGRDGGPDDYPGKRHSTRFTGKLQLDASTDPHDPSATWAVNMHDVSNGGLAFWTRQQVKARSVIYVRESTADGSRPWLPAQVTHVTFGIRGNLIGAEFVLTPGAVTPPKPGPRNAANPTLTIPGWRRPTG